MQKVFPRGTIVAGKYRIEKALARGGFSIVYRGTHIEMDRPVALKIMPLSSSTERTWEERFGREARLASQLNHPNTITIFDYGRDDGGYLYLIMEFIEGKSLRDVLRDSGPMRPERVAQMAIQMLKSLEEAHQRGFLHRDLKPSNIMLTEDFQGTEIVKVLDFGIAKIIQSPDVSKDALHLTHEGVFVGTPRYAPPEQLSRDNLTAATDIYGVGMVMWEALVGTPAVAETDYATCMERHISPAPWELPESAQCPSGLAKIVHKALRKEHQERYQSCDEMATQLSKWLLSSTVSRPVSLDSIRQQAAKTSTPPPTPKRMPTQIGAPPPIKREAPTATDVMLEVTDSFDDDEAFARLLESNQSPEELAALFGADAKRDRLVSTDLGVGGYDATPLEVSGRFSDDIDFMDMLSSGGEIESSLESPSDDFLDDLVGPPTQRAPRARPQPRPASAMRPQSPVHAPHPSRHEPLERDGGRQSGKAMLDQWVAYGPYLGGGALGLALVLVLLQIFVFGSDGEPNAAPEVALSSGATTELAQPGPTPAPTAQPEPVPATPLLSTNALILGIRGNGWSSIGSVDRTEMGGVTQTSARFAKRDAVIDVIISECGDATLADALLGMATLPDKAINIGHTVVKVGPGDTRTASKKAVDEVIDLLNRLVAIAEEQESLNAQ